MTTTKKDPEVVNTKKEPEMVNTKKDPEVVNTKKEPEVVNTKKDPEVVNTKKEPEVTPTKKDPEVTRDLWPLTRDLWHLTLTRKKSPLLLLQVFFKKSNFKIIGWHQPLQAPPPTSQLWKLTLPQAWW